MLEVMAIVQEHRRKMPRIGTRKLYYLIKDELDNRGLKVGRDKLFTYLRSQRMLIKPKRTYTKTTFSKHWLHKHPNLVKSFKPKKPEQLWVCDITYKKTTQKTTYLSLVTDAFSRKVMGYHLSEDLKADNMVKALRMALNNRVYHHPLIHHSDKGLQYCAEEYQVLLRENGINCSMTDGYDCYQNALAERMNGIIKNEFLLGKYVNTKTLSKAVTQAVHAYNNFRPHTCLNMKTPSLIHKSPHLW